jgi:hypothetical protein
MAAISRNSFFQDRQGRTFADVLEDSEVPFDEVLSFFNESNRQRRMEESEIHHDRPALAGVVRELESLPAIDAFLAHPNRSRSKRLRQAIGVVVRMVMESRGWRKTGKKGSLGVRAASTGRSTAADGNHNSGGLAYWFLRAERYARVDGMPFRSVRERCRETSKRAAQRGGSPGDPNWKPVRQSGKSTASTKLLRSRSSPRRNGPH